MHVLLFSDLDDFWYDWRKMFLPIRQEVIDRGHSEEVVDAALAELNETGFSFEAWLRELCYNEDEIAELAPKFERRLTGGYRYLLGGSEDVLHWLRSRSFGGRIGNVISPRFELDHELLTYGYPPYQRMKVAGLHSLVEKRFTDANYVWQDQTKGDFIAERGEDAADLVLFGDDSPKHLLDVLQKAPWTKCVRLVWLHLDGGEPHEGDGKLWDVIHGSKELIPWIRRQITNCKLRKFHELATISQLKVTLDDSSEYEEWRRFINGYGEDLLQSGPHERLSREEQVELSSHTPGTRVFLARWKRADDDGWHEIVGTVTLGVFGKGRGRICHIEDVLTHPGAREMSIGRALMYEALRYAHQINAGKVCLVSEPHRKAARALYESLGFELEKGEDGQPCSDRHYVLKRDQLEELVKSFY